METALCYGCGGEVIPEKKMDYTLKDWWWPRDMKGNFLVIEIMYFYFILTTQAILPLLKGVSLDR